MRILRLLLTIVLIQISLPSMAKKEYRNDFHWDEMTSLPLGRGEITQLGVAYPFAGVSKGAIIVVGGYGLSLDGETKLYDNTIYVLPKGSSDWTAGNQYKYNIANGASVTTPDGLLCIGGVNRDKEFSQVDLLSWNEKTLQVDITQYPALPFTMSECNATIIGNVVYLVGGCVDGKPSNKFMTLDLSKKGSSSFDWQILSDYPGETRLQPIAVAQNGAEHAHVYIFGGHNKNGDKISESGLVYNTTTKQWKSTTTTNYGEVNSVSLSEASAVAVGNSHILLIGGRATLSSGKKEFTSLVYNTITDSWAIGDNKEITTLGASVFTLDKDIIVITGLNHSDNKSDTSMASSGAIFRGRVYNRPIFGFVNWTVLALYMLGMLYMGYYFMRKSSNSTEDFFKGGGNIPWWAAGISIFATMLSAITFMAVPAKAFATDWRYFPMVVTILVMSFPVVKYFLPFFRRLNVTTAYEYLEKRFSYGVRLLASSLFIIFMLARMALALFLPSLALTTVTGIDIYLCIIMMGVITLIYCTMGGAEAVVWSDVVQGIILFGGALFVAIYLVLNIPGGLSTMIDITVAENKMRMFDFTFSWSNPTFYVIILGGLANNLISYSSDQTVIQRYITTNSEKAAGKSIIMNGFLSVFVSVIFYFIGTALYSFYKTHPESTNFMMQNTDSIFPHFIMAEIPVGFAGLIIAAIFAATMSTVSSNVNSLSTAYTVDIYRHFAKNSSDSKEVSVARIAGLVMGGLGIGIAILMATMNILSLFDFFNFLLGLLSSGIAALFLIGIFMPNIGSKSAMGGFIMANICLGLISTYTDISFWLYGSIGIALTIGFSLLFSLIFKNNKDINGFTWKTLAKQED